LRRRPTGNIFVDRMSVKTVKSCSWPLPSTRKAVKTMKKFRRSLCALLGAALFALCSTIPLWAEPLSEELSSQWNKLSDKLGQALELREKLPDLPDSAYFGADKKSANRKITGLLREAQSILLSSDALKLVKRSEQIKEKLPKLRSTVEKYREKRIGAPVKSYNPLTDTVADCDKKIAEAEKDMARLNNELQEIRGKILAEMRGWGLKITNAQADVLFSSVVGDDLLKNAVIFENVKDVTEQLSSLLNQSKNNLSLARKYYGMYMTLIDLLMDCQNRFVEQIDSTWIPQVDAIADSASKSLLEARAALKRSDFTEAQKNIFKSNVASNELTVVAASKYCSLLALQKKSVQNCVDNLKRDREVAANTYATVRHISDMSTVMRSGLRLFDVLSSMQLPEIQTFESDSVRREFDEITRRLQTQR
jgi:hypothetical protein